ncbi:hypothetical protein [Pseudomonas sp. PP3]|uniref:hypothetical protein n=1 Tax=Pseudomonas sp. PP3 TaxID=2815936 RepID=UPI001FD2CEB9|nr:hypothetical protein [Pseudomonas sp. PP3]
MNKALKEHFQLLMPMVFICALLSGIFLPIYSDEVVTKFKIARFFLEEGQMLSFFPQCTTTVGHEVAWVFYPAAALISSIYAYLGPLGLRISGIALALIWFALLAYWCLRQSKNSWSGHFTLLAALGSLGVLPYLWVLSRPEQFMFLPILIFCIAAMHPPINVGRWQQVGGTIALAVLGSVFFYAHSKTIFFTPFFLASAWISTRNFNVFLRTALIIYIIALSVQVLRNASLLGGCTDAPAIQAMLNANSLMPSQLLKDPYTFFSLIWENTIQFPHRLLVHLTFTPDFQSGWLPPLSDDNALLRWINPLIYYTLFLLVIGTHLFALGIALKSLVQRNISSATLLAALLAAADLINIMLFKLQNFYAGTQYIPISIIILALLLPKILETSKYATFNTGIRIAHVFITGLSLTSLFILFYSITPTLIKNSDYEYASIPGQPLSIPVMGVENHIKSIQELGKLCHIPESNAKHVVVDHMTYFHYLKDKSPTHVLYVSELGYGGDLTDGKLLPFLKKQNSPGIITRCEWMPKDFKNNQQKNDRGYCCINLNNQ